MKPMVYIETSVISYLTARPSRDLIVAAHQQITREWWHTRLAKYEPVISQLVWDEAGQGDPDAVKKRLETIQSLARVGISPGVERLAAELMHSGSLPETAKVDALHIAAASFYRMDYLVTWNCRHIANGDVIQKVEQVCDRSGVRPAIILTPEQLMGTNDDLERPDC